MRDRTRVAEVGAVALVLDVHHAGELVDAAVHAGRLAGVVEAWALVALGVRAVLIAHVHLMHAIQLSQQSPAELLRPPMLGL